MKPINLRIAAEAVSLLDSGATVPFVARYRKEATGALDDAQLRAIEERLRYLRELDERRATILDSISQQGKLHAALKPAIDDADSKARLEDLYLPFRPKRRTKAQIAREAGLESLAETLIARPEQSPEQVARRYVEPNKGVSDWTAALEGARAILVERFSEDATLIGTLREEVWSRGRVCSQVRAGKTESGAKFADYFEFSEPLAKLPSHRVLALFRGEKEDVLTLELVPASVATDRAEPSAFERQIASRFKIADHGRPGDRWLIETVR
jgi:protein Tex